MPGASLPYSPGRTFIFKLEPEADLLASITRFANDEGVKVGRVSAIGAVTNASFSYFNQETKVYQPMEVPGRFEIVSCSGNISQFKQRSFAHLHIVFADSEGRAFGGHLAPGTTVFACEVILDELLGGTLTRDFDPETGLAGWK
jgi:hypothetical protein